MADKSILTWVSLDRATRICLLSVDCSNGNHDYSLQTCSCQGIELKGIPSPITFERTPTSLSVSSMALTGLVLLCLAQNRYSTFLKLATKVCSLIWRHPPPEAD